MRRVRLRPAYTAEELAAIYPVPHDSSLWRDHEVRVAVTVGLGLGLVPTVMGTTGGPAFRLADLSCGDERIARALSPAPILGDLAPGRDLCGPIEETLPDLEPVDLFVCSETIEHLDDPDSVLNLMRAKTTAALVSTPIEAWNDHGNREHYWAWDREAVEAMFDAASFEVCAFVALDMRPAWSPYCFGVWALR